MKNKRLLQKRFRILVQVIFFIAFPSVYNTAFTGVKNIFTTFGQGKPLEMTSFLVQLIVVSAFTFFCGRFFCGWACAFGALGDWIYQMAEIVRKKLGRKKNRGVFPHQHLLQYVKYLILAGILLCFFLGSGNLVNENSPWTVFSLLRSGNLKLGGREVGIFLFVVILVGMAWKERFFCQFLCPMGAVFSLIPVLPFMQLRRKKESCPAKCGACHKNCPVDLFLDTEEGRDGECIRCGRCSGICPKGNISVTGHFRGDELWLDGIKAIVLLLLILFIQ